MLNVVSNHDFVREHIRNICLCFHNSAIKVISSKPTIFFSSTESLWIDYHRRSICASYFHPHNMKQEFSVLLSLMTLGSVLLLYQRLNRKTGVIVYSFNVVRRIKSREIRRTKPRDELSDSTFAFNVKQRRCAYYFWNLNHQWQEVHLLKYVCHKYTK